MKKYYWFIGLSLFLMSCIAQPQIVTKEYSYLALGDSYTIGESVAVAQRWPMQLVAKLKNLNCTIQTPKIIAKTGWRTDNLLNAIEKELSGNESYDIVSLLIGVNNQFQGKSIGVYKKELKALLDKAKKHCNQGKKGMFVLSIPDYGATPYGESRAAEIGKAIDEWNAACEAICKDYGVPFYFITEISRKGATEVDLVAEDGLHPSGKMYGLWVDDITGRVKQLLPKN
ncbi:MAG: SGNH/GDSL hydrolase family protein [Aureispira sp.]|nr:SGNH/GDSL hydrolase family protein [Aureispira sp.]